MQLGVLGTGSWGTALAVHWAQAGHQVRLWGRRPDFVAKLGRERRNDQYLADVPFPETLSVTADLADLSGLDTVVVAVPSHGFREALHAYLAVAEKKERAIVSATKGIETESLARMSEVTFEEGAAAGHELGFAVLSGPSFSAELAAGTPTLAVVASPDADLATRLRENLSTRRFRLYSSTDVVGVELGGTSKNVIAIAAGILTGLGLGHNTLAALLTRGLHEITRLGLAFGGLPRTLAGLAGMGDLVLTCTGKLSRNRHLGEELAAGKSLEEINASTSMVAEGARNSVAIARLAARREVEMPITQQVVECLYHGKSPRQAVEELMTRDLRAETEL